ncbi:hypothetical protein [Terasakiella pusilla]|uniref:hypothetical protein n=1 Tax=Terasakiella pusilla TaxID=64973 RepID=UPI003AA91669
MGWFDSITSFVVDKATDYFSDGDNLVNLAGNAIEAGVDYYTSSRAAKANEKAAQTVAQGYNNQAAAIREGSERAQRQFEEIQAHSKPGVTYLREVTNADPYQLTLGQRQDLDAVRRASINSLNQSGLRGSGRAVTEALRKVESDYRGNAINSNLIRSQNAANQLASDYSQASINSANASFNTGSRLGSLGVGAQEAEANADLANEKMKGAAIGSIQSLIKNEVKEGRKSKYGWE